MGNQGTVPYIHNLETWWVVDFIPLPLFSRKQLERRLGRPQIQFRHGGKQKNPFLS
jgi:hypothetical protein